MHANRFALEALAKRAADAYLEQGTDLNTSIAKIAGEEEMTPAQIDRVVQNANILVNGTLVASAREKKADPRVTFDMADSSKVAALRRPPSTDHKTAKIAALLTIPRPPAPNVMARVIGAVTDSGGEPPSHIKIAEDLMRGEKPRADAETISRACLTLEDLYARAKMEKDAARNALDDAERELCADIGEEILGGLSPATLKFIIKSAGLGEPTTTYVVNLVTKVAAYNGVGEGRAVKGTVNLSHHLLTKCASFSALLTTAVRMGRGVEKLAQITKGAYRAYAEVKS